MVNSIFVTTVYVNPSLGYDHNNGSPRSPFRTLTRALQAIKTPAIIHLFAGEYTSVNDEVFPIVIPSGVTVLGNANNKGSDVIIFGSGTYQSPSFGNQNVALLLQGNIFGVTVTNSVAKGTGIWIESGISCVSNSTLLKCGREGIFSCGTAKPAILDNVFQKNAASGLMMARYSKGEVLRNVLQNNPLGIVVTDFAAPLIAHNIISNNGLAISLTRNARPVLRHNLISKNVKGGMLVNEDATPNLGGSQDPAGNTFSENTNYDLHNATKNQLISTGNQLNPTQVRGRVEFPALLEDYPRAISSISRFSDVEGHWATGFIEGLVSRGVMSGFPNHTFAPEQPITRAEYASVIAKTFDLPMRNTIHNFIDVKTDFWATPAIMKSAEMGFITGFPDGTFRPKQNLTKVEALVSIVNGLKLIGTSTQVLNIYSDRVQIPSYAINAIATATQNLLVVNYPYTEQLEPLRNINRAEVAALIYQALLAGGQVKAIASPYIVTSNHLYIPSFTDIMGHWAEPFIRGLCSMNLTHGFADGTYKPDLPITRAQYAALVAVAFNPVAKRPTPYFTDMRRDFWAAEAIKIAASGGFLSGFGDATFRPEQNIQRLQVILSLVSGLGLTTTQNHSSLNYHDNHTIPKYALSAVAAATENRIVVNYPDPKQLLPMGEATRGDVAAMIYQALTALQRTPTIHSPYIASTFDK